MPAERTRDTWDATKFKEAILYVCQRSEADPRFGSVKLNKILFYADFWAYLELGHPITDATYQHLAEGPAPREMLSCRAALESEGALRTEDRRYHNRVQKRPVTLRGADTSHFDEQELRILNEAVDALWQMDASDVSAKSQEEWGWRVTREGEDIPYSLAWLSPDPLSQEQIKAAQLVWDRLHGTRTMSA